MNQSYSRDLTNRKNNTQGGSILFGKPLPSSYCVQLLIRHLYCSFIFDAQLFLNLGFFERVGGNNREGCWEPALAAWAFLWQPSVAGIGFLGFGVVWFGLVFLSNEVHEPVACIIFQSVLHHFTCLDYKSMWFLYI